MSYQAIANLQQWQIITTTVFFCQINHCMISCITRALLTLSLLQTVRTLLLAPKKCPNPNCKPMKTQTTIPLPHTNHHTHKTNEGVHYSTTNFCSLHHKRKMLKSLGLLKKGATITLRRESSFMLHTYT